MFILTEIFGDWYLRLPYCKAQDLQHKLENAGGEELKQKKALVEKLQKVQLLSHLFLHVT